MGVSMSATRRTCFISYHHADEAEVRDLITQFDDIHDVFIRRGLGLDMEVDIINSTDTDYVCVASGRSTSPDQP